MRKGLLNASLICLVAMTPRAWSADAPATPSPAQAKASEAAHAFAVGQGADTQFAFLDKYCGDCHNSTYWTGGVSFETMAPESIPSDAKTWEAAVRKLRGRLMPPAGKPQPEATDIKSFVSWMEHNLDAAAQAQPNPGRVALQRLNRKEYGNAVRDLLGAKIDVTAILPQDDAADGFDNVANVLQVSPSFLEQYVSAARSVAIQAVGDRGAKLSAVSYSVKDRSSQYAHVDGLPLGTRGGLVVEHEFPVDGEYELNIGNMARALWVYNMEFENTVVATLDGKRIFETKIGGEEDMKSIDQQQDVAVDAINARLKKIRFSTTAGAHKLAVTFLHRTYAESEDRLHALMPGIGQDRVLGLSSFDIRGPFNPVGLSETESRKTIFTCYPATAAEEQPCADRIIESLATRAFRRPVTEAELQPLRNFYTAGRQSGDFENGVRRSLTAILASPYFLYRAEIAPASLASDGIYRINDLELATKLAFFLWSSLPDTELLQLANQKRLSEPAVLEAQVRRMLADRRSETLASNFAFQWLNMAKLAEIEPDPNVFPYAGDPRDDFRTELRLFVDSIFREDRSVVDLLTADHTYLNERLALHYDINTIKGDRFRRVTLDNSARWGLLGKGAVLMVSSYPNRTAPVLRGAWILERIMGTPPAPPPPNVEALRENQAGKKALTVRELMAQHRSNATCFSCHGIMDPLGFALENFDGVGKWRSIDRFAGTPIDSSGVLPDGTNINSPDDLRNALAGNPDQFVQTVTQNLMTYALGRSVEYYDMPTVRAIVHATAKDNYRFSSLVLNIVNSEAFQKRKVQPDPHAPGVQLTQSQDAR